MRKMGKARDLAWLFFINLFISAFTFGAVMWWCP